MKLIYSGTASISLLQEFVHMFHESEVNRLNVMYYNVFSTNVNHCKHVATQKTKLLQLFKTKNMTKEAHIAFLSHVGLEYNKTA